MKYKCFILLLVISIILTGCSNQAIDNISDDANNDYIEEIDQSIASEIKENISDKYEVIRVVDGDTIIIDFNGKDERVRLIGIDTPESVHPDASRNVEEGLIASEYTKFLLEGKLVELEFDVEERDRYGRLLAYVYVDGEMLNKTLIKEGYATIATFPPNVKYVDDFIALQEAARENKKGLWSAVDDDIIVGNNIDNVNEYSLIGSVNSDKYHLNGYTHVGQISEKNIVYFNNIEDAESKGYKPCGICFGR